MRAASGDGANIPVFLLVALAAASAQRSKGPATERFLSWILLRPIGVTALWAAARHVFIPAISRRPCRVGAEPLQFEVGMADLAIGVTACLAFRASLDFKAAAVCAASVFLLGDAIGHVHQMLAAGNFAPGNAGVPFYMDILCPMLAVALLVIARRQERR